MLSREQLIASLFDESSSEEEEDSTVHILSPGRSQPPASLAPGDPTTGSWRYHPSTPIEDVEDSTEDEKPPMDPEELDRIAQRILKTTPPVSEADEPVAAAHLHPWPSSYNEFSSPNTMSSISSMLSFLSLPPSQSPWWCHIGMVYSRDLIKQYLQHFYSSISDCWKYTVDNYNYMWLYESWICNSI